jgi:hypothetical protein
MFPLSSGNNDRAGIYKIKDGIVNRVHQQEHKPYIWRTGQSYKGRDNSNWKKKLFVIGVICICFLFGSFLESREGEVSKPFLEAYEQPSDL